MATKHVGNLSFVTRWFEWIQNQAGYTTKRHEIDFSEGLLKTLFYETDIGSIPRGAETDDTPPKYKDNPNWKKHISDCYWCLRDKTHVQGICCSKECIYYLHEWCVERAELFQARRFCKRPGCDNPPYRQDYSCCSGTHYNEYTELYKWVTKEQLNGLTKKGPPWYDKEVSFNNTYTPSTQYNPFISTTSATKSATMDLATELKASLIFYTDIGPIPRSYKKSEHSVSQHSSCANWRADITGCYQCGGPVTQRCEYLCSHKCYSIFNEWCRQKVVDANKKEFCEYPGCGKEPQEGHSTCCREHFEKKNAYLASNECYKLFKQGPHWYKSTENSSSGAVSPSSNQNQTHSSHENSQNPFSPFSRVLKTWMYNESDIGPIPRSLIQLSHIRDMNRTIASNWNTIIPGCYWCCGGSTLHIHGIACSEQCFFLFNEWCHKKYNSSTFKQICKIPQCGASVDFKRDSCYAHTTKYSSDKMKFGHLLKTSDFALGPKWYSNKSDTHIDFYNREDPFYEFTNFFPCTTLSIDGKQWRTTEHYFQSQKLIGTPCVEYVRGMNSPRETFEYARRSSTQKWIRPDWALVKERIMLKALEAKFSQNNGLAQLLIRTGDMQLFEHTRNDKFWGDGGDRKGQNKLGKLLSQVRFDLQRKSPFLPSTLKHIDFNMSQAEVPAHRIPSSVGNMRDTSRNISMGMFSAGDACTSVIAANTQNKFPGAPWTGAGTPVEMNTSDVPHGASNKSICNSDTDNTLSDSVIINNPKPSSVMFSNYGGCGTSNSLTNTSPPAGTSANNTSSQTGKHSTEDKPYTSFSSIHSLPSNFRPNTANFSGNVKNRVGEFEKFSSPKNDVGTNTNTELINNLRTKNRLSPLGIESAPVSTSPTSTPSKQVSHPSKLHMELKMNNSERTSGETKSHN